MKSHNLEEEEDDFYPFSEDGKRPKSNIFRRIYLWWNFEGRYLWKGFKQGIRNLIKWLPIIWKDRDWDHSFIYRLLEQKLINQATYIGSHNRHTTAKRDAEVMMTCARLIDRIREDYYGTEYIDYHKSRMKFVPIPDQPGYSEMVSTELSERFDEYFAKYPLVYKKVTATDKFYFENKDKHSIAMNIAHYNGERAKDLLHKILRNNIERWWD